MSKCVQTFDRFCMCVLRVCVFVCMCVCMRACVRSFVHACVCLHPAGMSQRRQSLIKAPLLLQWSRWPGTRVTNIHTQTNTHTHTHTHHITPRPTLPCWATFHPVHRNTGLYTSACLFTFTPDSDPAFVSRREIVCVCVFPIYNGLRKYSPPWHVSYFVALYHLIYTTCLSLWRCKIKKIKNRKLELA